MRTSLSYYIEPEDLDNIPQLLSFLAPLLYAHRVHCPDNPQWDNVRSFMLRCRADHPYCSFEVCVTGGYDEYQLLSVYAIGTLDSESIDLVEAYCYID